MTNSMTSLSLLQQHRYQRAALNLTLITLAFLTLGHATGAQAQVAPNAGQVLRELQPAPVFSLPQKIPLQVNPAQPSVLDPNAPKLRVNAIVLLDNQELPTESLQPLVADLIGTEQTLAQLNAAAARITAHYRAAGYAVARAYLPAQDVKDGVITIRIIEGRISGHRLDNQSGLSDATVQTYLEPIKNGDIVKSAQIDRIVLLLQDTPGVSSSRATLQPGASVGTTELLVEVKPADKFSASVGLDNYGSRYTGVFRLSTSLALANLNGIGDQLSLDALKSEGNLNFGRLAYQLPVGGDGLRAGAAYLNTHYVLGKEFAALGAHGMASSTSVFVAYPFVRSPLQNLSGSITQEIKNLSDTVDSTATVTDKTVNITSVGMSGNLHDNWGGGGVNSLDATLAVGQLRFDASAAQAIDAASAQTSGAYSRWSYNASRLQYLTPETALWLSVGGQQASKNLDSSEKFALAGINGVRAYPQGEALGDEGMKATLELRQKLTDNVQGSLFYDSGKVTINKNTYGAAAINSRSLAGAGIGLQVDLGSAQIKASLAWPTDKGAVTSIPSSANQTPTVWVQSLLRL